MGERGGTTSVLEQGLERKYRLVPKERHTYFTELSQHVDGLMCLGAGSVNSGKNEFYSTSEFYSANEFYSVNDRRCFLVTRLRRTAAESYWLSGAALQLRCR